MPSRTSQKALSWAYRSLARLDPAATTAALVAETDTSVARADGHRAWVIRDSLSKFEPAVAEPIRERLAGVRRRPGAPATSRAFEISTRFGDLPDPTNPSEPASPLTGQE